jgi:hypothetical protein
MSWHPEVCYEESEGGLTSKIPFIPVPIGENMPKLLFIFESRETGEFEPGFEGEDLPVTELDLHQYADMAVLKSALSPGHYDLVREALDLEPMVTAAQKGKVITDKIKGNVQPESV